MRISKVFLKLENLQPSGSFKSRGIGNFLLSKLTALRSQSANGNDYTNTVHFYSSSGGNAGLGCVHAAVTLGCRATVVVPLSTSQYMISKLRSAGATDVIQHGASWQEADGYLKDEIMTRSQNSDETPIYVPPFDAQEIWDGNALMVDEIAQQLSLIPKNYPVSSEVFVSEEEHDSPRIDAIVCSVGGGGLFCGIMQGVDELQHPKAKVIAMETCGADSLAQAVEKNALVTLPSITSIATSLGARTVSPKALEYSLKENVSNVVLSDREAIEACRRFASDERILVEPACGVSIAMCYNSRLGELIPNFNSQSVVVIVVCGGSNISFEILENYMKEAAKV